MLDFLIKAKSAEKQPWKMFFIGLIYSSLAILMSLWVFKSHATLVMIFLTVLSCMHFTYILFRIEEKRDLKSRTEKKFLIKQHGPALLFLVFLFLGFTVSYSLWYIFLPSNVSQDLFSSQIDAYNKVNITGNAINPSALMTIFMNNMRVLLFTILFAFFYGAGAIFIFAWNASVIGFAIGNVFRNKIANLAATLGWSNIASYFAIYSSSILKYLTHGVLEILAYFMGALGAGIIAIAVIRHDYNDKNFSSVLLDSLDLIVLSVILLLFAAVIEVYVTPALF